MGGTFAFSCLKDFVQQYDYREIMFLLSTPGAHCYRIMESNALCKAGDGWCSRHTSNTVGCLLVKLWNRLVFDSLSWRKLKIQ